MFPALAAPLLHGHNQVLDALARGALPRDAALLLCRQIERLVPQACVSLLAVDAHARLLALAAPSLPPVVQAFIDGLPIGVNMGGCGRAAWSGRPVVTADIAADPLWAGHRALYLAHGLRACWSLPVLDGEGAVLGTLAIHYRTPCEPSAGHQQIAQASLPLCALLLGHERARLRRPGPEAPAPEPGLQAADLRAALADGRLALHYQPQVDGHDGTLRGVEALLRWTHPRLGPIAPLHAVALAEESGLIEGLTQWVLGEACRQLADWRARGLAVPRVSINLQASSLRDGSLPRRFMRTLAVHGLRPEDLVAEVTETVMLTPDPAVLDNARALRDCGIALSLDDFGTGYSSLGALHRLPINELKLDKSFVQDLESSATARALTSAVLHIGESLGMQVVAEGVETEGQSRFLAQRNCPLLQGYLHARPLPAGQLEAWLASRAPGYAAGGAPGLRLIRSA